MRLLLAISFGVNCAGKSFSSFGIGMLLSYQLLELHSCGQLYFYFLFGYHMLSKVMICYP